MRSCLVLQTWIYSLFLLLSLEKRAYGQVSTSSGELPKRLVKGHKVDDRTSDADYFHFVTRPDIRIPKWNITLYKKELIKPGYWFVAPYAWLGQEERGEAWVGPYIYDGQGELIWSGAPLFDSFNIFDFRPIQIRGEQMFTAIYKREDAGLIVDNSYRIKKIVEWPGAYDVANMHEFALSDEGDEAAIFSHEVHNLSPKKRSWARLELLDQHHRTA